MENEADIVTWIDINKLKLGCRVDSIYSESDFNHYLCVSEFQDVSESQSAAGVTSEMKPNTLTHDMSTLSSMHKKYFKEIDKQVKIIEETTEVPRRSLMISKILSKDIKNGENFFINSKLLKELQKELKSINSEVDILKSEKLKLNQEIESLKQAHVTSLENLQARHEKKYSHRKQGFEEILNEIVDSKEPLHLSHLSRSHLLELSNLKSLYEQEILRLRLNHSKEVKSLKRSLEDTGLESTSFRSEFSVEQPLFDLSPSSIPSTPEFTQGFSTNMKNENIHKERQSLQESLEFYQTTVDALSESLLSITETMKTFRNGLLECLDCVGCLLEKRVITKELIVELKDRLESLESLTNFCDGDKS